MGADVRERRDFARQLLGQRDDVNAVGADDRIDERLIRRQTERDLGEAFRRGEFLRAGFGAERRGRPDGQTFLLRDGGEIARARGREVENGAGKFVGLRAGVGSARWRIIRSRILALAASGVLASGNACAPYWRYTASTCASKFVFAHSALDCARKFDTFKRDIIDLHAVGQAVFREIIRVKLCDGLRRHRDGRQIIFCGKENGLRGELLMFALVNAGGFLRRDERAGRADGLNQLPDGGIMAEKILEVGHGQAFRLQNLFRKFVTVTVWPLRPSERSIWLASDAAVSTPTWMPRSEAFRISNRRM